MAELGQPMDIDSRPAVPPRDISKRRETNTPNLNQWLDPIRQAVRDEVRSALSDEQRTVSESVFGRGSMTRPLSTTIR